MSFINFFSVSQPAVAKLGGTCPLWRLINDGTDKEGVGFPKCLDFLSEDDAQRCGEKQNWFGDLSCNYLIFISAACLSAFYYVLCQHTHYY